MHHNKKLSLVSLRETVKPHGLIPEVEICGEMFAPKGDAEKKSLPFSPLPKKKKRDSVDAAALEIVSVQPEPRKVFPRSILSSKTTHRSAFSLFAKKLLILVCSGLRSTGRKEMEVTEKTLFFSSWFSSQCRY